MKSTPKASTEYLEELRIQLRSQGFTVHCNESRDVVPDLDKRVDLSNQTELDASRRGGMELS